MHASPNEIVCVGHVCVSLGKCIYVSSCKRCVYSDKEVYLGWGCAYVRMYVCVSFCERVPGVWFSVQVWETIRGCMCVCGWEVCVGGRCVCPGHSAYVSDCSART